MSGLLGAAWQQVEFRLAWAACSAIRALPRARRIALAGRLGRMLIPNLPMTARRISANLDRIWPGLERERRRAIARGVGDNFGRTIIEYFLMDDLARQPDLVSATGAGLAAIRQARDEGRGAVLVSAHFGNWEAIRLALQADGIPCAMIYRAFNNRPFDAYVRAKMEHAGTPVLTKGRQGMRALVGHVAKGGVALILVDQKQTGAPALPFLGQPAETSLAAASLASRLGVPLIPAFATRQNDGRRFAVEFETPVSDGPPEARMAQVNARISARIEARPEQWFWLHRRWR
ncbi:MAG: lauroyl acyltransferase [Alphaproteobacteria bacterium]|nr:MAG: lauroyl acyltransferase [Alphaproteobacteria bacterium]